MGTQPVLSHLHCTPFQSGYAEAVSSVCGYQSFLSLVFSCPGWFIHNLVVILDLSWEEVSVTSTHSSTILDLPIIFSKITETTDIHRVGQYLKLFLTSTVGERVTFFFLLTRAGNWESETIRQWQELQKSGRGMNKRGESVTQFCLVLLPPILESVRVADKVLKWLHMVPPVTNQNVLRFHFSLGNFKNHLLLEMKIENDWIYRGSTILVNFTHIPILQIIPNPFRKTFNDLRKRCVKRFGGKSEIGRAWLEGKLTNVSWSLIHKFSRPYFAQFGEICWHRTRRGKPEVGNCGWKFGPSHK